MEKRGQFYLIAALVIIAIITSLSTIHNFAKTKTGEAAVYDLTSEIDFEASQVIDSGIFLSFNETDRAEKLENLTDYYAKANAGSDLLVIFGNENTLTLILYNDSQTGSVGISFGGSPVYFPQYTERKFKNSSVSYGPKVSVSLPPGINYTFDLGPGQVFFIVLKKETEGESYISSSDPTSKQSKK